MARALSIASSPARTEMIKEAWEREKRILQLRIGGLTFAAIGEKIAEEEGLPVALSAKRVGTIVKRALGRTLEEIKQESQHLRTMELLRLDRMQAAIWDKALEGGTKEIDRILSIMQRRATLLGLDQPQQHELLITDGRKAEDYSDDELAQILAHAKNITPDLPETSDDVVDADLVALPAPAEPEDLARVMSADEREQEGIKDADDDSLEDMPEWLDGVTDEKDQK